MRTRSVVSWIISLTMIGAGLALVGVFFLEQTSGSTAASTGDPGGFNVPKLGNAQAPESTTAADKGPEDKTLTVTIPEMRRIEDDTIPDAAGTDRQALRRNAAIHLKGTGFPWQEEANVYLAGHRLGYPGTDSFLTFYDQEKLEKGDKIFVTDSEGKEYTYRVFKEFVVKPTDVSVTKPVEGKNILTLQTCTLPNYTERVITQAELVKVEQA